MPLQLAPTQLCIDHDTGGTDALAVKDSCGNAVQYARVLVYRRTDFDAGIYSELGVTETDANGRWLTPVLLAGWAAREQLYIRAYRAAGYRISSDGVRRFYGAWGPTTVEIACPCDYLLDNADGQITDQGGASILCADIDPGYHPMAIRDDEGAAVLDWLGAQILEAGMIG